MILGLELLVIAVLLSGIAWLFGVDGKKLVAFWTVVTTLCGVFVGVIASIAWAVAWFLANFFACGC